MKKLLSLLLSLALCLGGCAGRQLEEELLVIVLGVDGDGDNHIALTVKVPSAASQSREDGDGYLLFSAEGLGFADALSVLRAAAPRQLNFSQVREIVFGAEAARRPDFSVLLSQIDLIHRFRCSAALIVCRGEAKAFLEAQKPDLGVRLSRYADATLAHAAGVGFTPDTDLCKAMRDLGLGFQDPLLILGAVQEEAGEVNDENALFTLPGALPREGAGSIEMYGAAATDGVCVSGELTGYEMALLHLTAGGAASLTMRQEANVPLQLSARSPARLEVDLSARPAVVKLSLACAVHYPPGSPPEERALRDALERDYTALLRHLQALRCDGLGFGNVAVRQFLTVQEWEKIGWREVYAGARVQVTVTLQCSPG